MVAPRQRAIMTLAPMPQRNTATPAPATALKSSSEPIASTKLLPPRGARRLMPREGLIARLQEARRQRCVIVQGPAGSGKTSTLVAWRQALLALDYDVAWLSLASDDDELARFFDCLLASLAEVDPALVQETALLLGRDSDETAVEHWVITLVQAIARRPRELVLMLDDVQNLDDPHIFEALQWLLEYAPPHLHLVLGTRHPVPMPLALSRLRAQGLIGEFDLSDLRFSPEESERYLREQLGSIAPREARTLHELTDGWVAGLQLLAVDMKAKHGSAFAPVAVRDAQAFASYFEREVLVRLAPDDLELLTRMAVCNRFCASLCATLLGQPQALARMTTHLAHLDAQNLFISQVGSHDRESWYRLHPLLREVLLARLAQRPIGEQQALHRAAWRWFESRGHVDEAVRHAVQAGEAQAAADLVEGCALELLAHGELTQLANLMRRLPAEPLQSRFRLRIARAHLQLYALRTDELRANLAELETDFGPLAPRDRYSLTLLRGGLAFQTDDTAAARAIVPALQDIPEDAEPHAFAGRNHVLAWMHMFDGDFAAARALLADNVAHNAGRMPLTRSLEGLCHLLQGHMGEAESALRGVLQIKNELGHSERSVQGVASALLGDVLYEANELDAARDILEPRVQFLLHASIPDAVSRALLVLCCTCWLKGRYLDALDHLDRLEEYGTRHALDRPLAYALALRLRWQLRRGETVEAQSTLDRMVLLAARQAGRESAAAAEVARMAERARAEMSLHWNDFDAAIARLEPVLAEAQATARTRNVATLLALLACAEAGRGNAAASRRHLMQALRLGHRLGLVRSLLDVSRHMPELLEALLQAEPLDPVLAFYVRRVVAAARASQRHAPPPAAPSATAAIESFSEREREVLNLVAQALPNKKIARVLGVTPHTVKWHLRKIYAKLGVAERDEAVARLRDMELGRENTGGPGGAN